MIISFALALNTHGVFEKIHFGDSDKFAIYTEVEHQFVFKEEVINSFKNFDEEQLHGSQKKGAAIISVLKERNVNVLVSKQFGRNVKMINKHFVPIVIHEDTPDNVIKILEKHKNWIKDELENRETDHMLFYIKSGILKLKIKEN